LAVPCPHGRLDALDLLRLGRDWHVSKGSSDLFQRIEGEHLRNWTLAGLLLILQNLRHLSVPSMSKSETKYAAMYQWPRCRGHQPFSAVFWSLRAMETLNLADLSGTEQTFGSSLRNYFVVSKSTSGVVWRSRNVCPR